MMKPEKFCEWLQGYVEIDGSLPSVTQWKAIKDKLATVKFSNEEKNIEDYTFQDLFDKIGGGVSKFKKIIDDKLNQDLSPEELDKKAKEIIDFFGDKDLELFLKSFEKKFKNSKLVKKIEELLELNKK